MGALNEKAIFQGAQIVSQDESRCRVLALSANFANKKESPIESKFLELKARDAQGKMIRQQLLGRGITDERVLSAMGKIRRHRFVEEAFFDRAYGDYPLPIGEKQTISQPYMVAFMSQLLQLEGTERVLELGTGSGYQTAILAELAAEVCSIERIRSLALAAITRLQALGYENVKIRCSDGTLGWKDGGKFDAILVAAACRAVPKSLIEQLSPDGRMVIPVGGEFSQKLRLIKKEHGKITEDSGCDCVFVKLIGKYGW
jgi:protein-L-isoaspartate(D-aspartate) O-methyltransferase